MPLDPQRVQDVFLAAVELPNPADRAAFLDRECAADAKLRRRVESLLRASDDPDRFLDQPVIGSAACADVLLPAPSEPDPSDNGTIYSLGLTRALDRGMERQPRASRAASNPIRDGAGARIGPYRLLEKIGEGGMGWVYLARQEKPVRRRVALKIIKPGMNSEQAMARFEAERQALVLMDHQNIARVLDVGTTRTGRPFFVMELVLGASITEYCDRNQFTTKERLQLFIPVCQAIQHAHQNGIIHRDIKPSNVLVTVHDGKPVVKVIDFGVAKAVEQRHTERGLRTQYGSIIGTIEYMSPEQAEFSAPGIDTRSDIYSLGVLLYELLTGTTPLERHTTFGSPYAEILRRIREDEAPKPSMRLSGSKDTLCAISAQRKTEPARLMKLLRGELDWIVMKALEKDRTRRYESASALARDIERFLDGDAVDACPPSAVYRLKKFARKNRGAITTVAAFAVLLLAGAVLGTFQAIRATSAEAAAIRQAKRAKIAEEQSRREADRAVAAERQTASERDRAITAESQSKIDGEKAEQSATLANAVLRFFQDQVLSAARPEGFEGGLGKDVTIRKAIDVAEPQIAGAFPGQGATEASVRSVLGDTYYYLGEPALSVRQRELALTLRVAALGPDHPDTLSSQNSLAVAYWAAGHPDRSIPLLQRAVLARGGKLGPDHPETLQSQNYLALAYQATGDLDRAIPLFERTLASRAARLGPDHPDTLATQSNLANGYRVAGHLERALALSERTVASQSARLGPDHPDTLSSRNTLANAYRDAGHNDRSIPLLEQTLAMGIAKLGPDHPRILIAQSILATALLASGQRDRAIPLFERTLAAQSAKLGPDHPDTLTGQTDLSNAYRDAGQNDRAIPLLERTLETLTAKLGASHIRTLAAQSSLANAYRDAGRLDRAIPLFERTLSARSERLGPDHPDTLASQHKLANAYRDAGRDELAIPLLERTLAGATTKLGADHPSTLTTRCDLACAYAARGNSARAETMLRDVLAARKQKLGAHHPQVAHTLAELGKVLLEQQKWAEAEPLLRAGLSIWKACLPDDWNRFNTSSLLGYSLLGQKKFAEAEPLLVTGYEEMRNREAIVPASQRCHLSEAAERTVQLYEAWGKRDQAAAWRARRIAAPARHNPDPWDCGPTRDRPR